jgi:autotransporter-associated beta strand protein
MKTPYRLHSFHVVCGLCLLAALFQVKSHAAVRTWDGGGTNSLWTTAANWVGDVVPGPGDDLVFPEVAARLSNDNNFPADTSFNTVTFIGSDFVLTGSRIRLNGGINANQPFGLNSVATEIILGANQTFAVTDDSLYFEAAIDTDGKDLTFSSFGEIQVQGAISGGGGVIKVGAYGVDLSGANTYQGVTLIKEGTLGLLNHTALGNNGSGTVVSNGAHVQLLGNITVAEPLILHGKLSTSSGAGSGLKTWAGPISLMATNSQIEVGTAPLAITGLVSGNGGLTKLGNLTLTLANNNTYTGVTTNLAGLLLINGNQPQSPIVIAGGTLGGTGTVGTITTSGFFTKTLSPGVSAGILSSSNVTLSSLTTFQIELNGETPGSGYDQLNVRGTADLDSAALSLSLGFTPNAGTSFVIINNDGTEPVHGEFSGRSQGSVFSVSGQTFQISYIGGTGNDVVLTRSPATRFTSVARLGNGQVQLVATGGLSGFSYTVEAATNLNPIIQWFKVGSAFANSGGQFLFTDTNAPLFPMRYYRAQSP